MVFPNEEQAGELLQAQAHVWNYIFSFISSSSLKCAVELNIPDIIHKHGKPITISELIDALPINKEKSNCVPRLMRFLTHSGFFVKSTRVGGASNELRCPISVGQEHIASDENEEKEGYLLTASSRLLLNEEPLSMKPFLLAMLDPLLVDPWQLMSEWFKNDRPTPFEMAHGRTFWDYAGHEPKMNNFFNEAMASDSKMVTGLVIRESGRVFDGINSLVDVGGGTGTVAKAFGEAFQELHECIVLDLPRVVDGLKGNNNLSYVGGDMFDYIPPADAVLLKWILHDWSDDECVKILKKCKEAISSKEKGGKVIIIDMIVDNQKEDDESMKGQLYFDMLMMAMLTGRERNEKDWSKLFFDAGFSDYKITPLLGLRSLIELYP